MQIFNGCQPERETAWGQAIFGCYPERGRTPESKDPALAGSASTIKAHLSPSLTGFGVPWLQAELAAVILSDSLPDAMRISI
jgi:hypothetical protein